MIKRFFGLLIFICIVDSCGNDPKSGRDGSESNQTPAPGLRVSSDPENHSVLKPGQVFTIRFESNPPLSYHKVSEHPDLDCFAEKSKGRYVIEYSCRISGEHDLITLDLTAKNSSENIKEQLSFKVQK